MTAPPASAPSPAFRLHTVGRTDVGRERSVNEDAMFFDDRLGLYLVCDGMGGHASGQIASQMAIQTIAAVAGNGAASPDGRDPLVHALEAANREVFQRSQSDAACHGMGTTAVAMRVGGRVASIAHVGDSRAYLLRDGELTQLTRDHSLSNLYADKPELAGKLGPATSNVIVRAIGLEPQVAVDQQFVEIREGDLVLLCCDGLSDLVDHWILHEQLVGRSDLAAAADTLVATANNNGGTDNITVVLVEIGMPAAEFADAAPTRPGY